MQLNGGSHTTESRRSSCKSTHRLPMGDDAEDFRADRVCMGQLAACIFGLLALAMPAGAQALGDFGLSLFGGPAWKTASAARPYQLGMGGEVNLFRRGAVGLGAAVEGGLFHPAISGKGNYYASMDAMLSRMEWEGWMAAAKVQPFAVAGYTRFFYATDTAINPANAVNFGVGVDRALREDLRLRVELREHYTPGSNAHALVLRIGVVGVDSVR
jgi:hypothetical protein